LGVLALTCALALASLVIGVPGTFVIFGAALLYAWATGFTTVTWSTLAWLIGLAVVGEGLELASSAVGSAKERPSRRTAGWALAGGLVGGIIGTPFLFGIGSLLGALAGAFTGAALSVMSQGGDVEAALRSGFAALRGRFLGFVVKLAIAVVMVVVLFTAAI
jgi:uncharacterized protein YqgC (DUF456 family)